MAEFKYENFVMRFSYFVACAAFFGVLYYAYWTESNVELPKDNKLPVAEEAALVAEESVLDVDKDVMPQTEPYLLLKEPQKSKFLTLEKSHRTNNEIQNWINTAVSESLSFDVISFSSRYAQIRPYYTSSGLKQYREYLKTSDILTSLKNNNYRMSVFIDEKPLLLNSVSAQGIYRWLYQLPITISFLPRDTNSLLGQTEAVNQKLTLRVQMRRVKLPDDPNAIQIESWTVTGRR